MLRNISLGSDQTIDFYLWSTITIVDSLVAIQLSFSDLELNQFTAAILFEDDNSLLPTFLYFLKSKGLMTCAINCSFISSG